MTLRCLLAELLFLHATLHGAAAVQCEEPFNVLSSDCQDLGYPASIVCLVRDQRPMWSSCDLIDIQIVDQPPIARLYITFSPTQRALRVAEEAFASRAGQSRSRSLFNVIAPVVTTPSPTAHSSSSASTSGDAGFDHLTPSPSTVPSSSTGSASGYTAAVIARPGAGPSHVGSGPSNNGSAVISNDLVKMIGPLRLDPDVTDLQIIGGLNEFGTRGQTITLLLDRTMLTSSPQVTSLSLPNCGIGSALSPGGFLKQLPMGLTSLNLRNTLLYTEPKDLSSLQNLIDLRLEQNFLSTFSSQVSLLKLTLLDLSENALTAFEANLPELKSLYLNNNKLNAIPNVVYSMSKLQELYLSENPIASIVISKTQYNFLSKLRLKLDKPLYAPLPPTIFVPGNSTPGSTTGVALDDRNLNRSDVVTVSVGTLTDLQGIAVWKLPDPVYDAFSTQQEVITKSNGMVIGGVTVQPYQPHVTAAVSGASSVSTTSENTALEVLTNSTTQSMDKPLQDRVSSSVPQTSNSNSNDTSPPLSSNENLPSLPGNTSIPTRDVSNRRPGTSSKSVKTLIVSIVSVCAVAVLVLGFVIVHRRRGPATKESASSTATTPRHGSSDESYEAVQDSKSARSVQSRDITTHDAGLASLFASRRIRAIDLEDVRVVTTDSHSVVWLVKLRGTRFLTSKRLLQSREMNQKRITEFVNEIVIAADLDYPKVVRLVGVAWTTKTDLQALYEYMPNGDLETYLKHTSSEILSWSNTKLKMVIDIIEALVYTHSFNPPLLHRDVRTRNVLLNEALNPKLSNFGLSRFASEQNTMTTDGIGSARWLAPEILRGSSDYEAPSDMYAFGVLLCELDTHKTPYEDVRDASGTAMSETGLTELVACGKLRPTLSESCPPEIRDLVTRCLAQDPHYRPTAMQVAYELRRLVLTITG